MENINVKSILFTDEELEVVRMAMIFAKDGYFQEDLLDEKGKEAFERVNDKIQSESSGYFNIFVAPQSDRHCDYAELEMSALHKDDAEAYIKENDLSVVLEPIAIIDLYCKHKGEI